MSRSDTIRFGVIGAALAGALSGCATSSEAPATACDRACLSGAITQYMDALLQHDPSKLPLAANVKFTENQKIMPIADAPLWKGASRPRDYRQDIIDVRDGVAGSHIILEEYGVPVMLLVRLKLVDKKITEIETQVTRNQTEGAIFAIDNLKTASPTMLYAPKPEERNTRDDLIKIAVHYPDGLKAGSFVEVDAPFAADAYRFENGRLMAGKDCVRPAGCDNIKAQKIPKLSKLTYRVAAVDEEQGITWIRMDFGPGSTRGAGSSLIVWEAFKVYGGQIHAVEAFMRNAKAGSNSGWD
jgi:hypothetical protein